MDNYLTLLYFEKFKITEKEKNLRSTHEYNNENHEIRNDQSIHEVSLQQEMINKLIIKYIEKIKNE